MLPYCVQVYLEEAWCMRWSECVMAFYAVSAKYDGAVQLWEW